MNSQYTNQLKNSKRLEKRIGQAFSLATIAIFLGGVVYVFFGYGSQRLLVILLIGLPWMIFLLVISLRKYCAIDLASKSDVKQALLLDGPMLCLLAIFDFSSAAWLGPLVMVILGAGFLVLGAANSAPALFAGRRQLATFAIVFGAYGYGAGMEINALLDSRSPKTYPVEVTAKRHGTIGAAAYFLTVGPWGSMQKVDEIVVREELYGAAKIGDKLCVNSHHGALSVPWYTLTVCSPNIH